MTTKFSDCHKIFNGINRLQPTFETTKLASYCSKKLEKRRNFVSSTDYIKVQGFDEQVNLALKVVDGLDHANEKICLTLLQYNVVKPKVSHIQLRLFARKQDDKFQQNVHVKQKLAEFFYFFAVMICVNDEVITKKPSSNIHQKVIATVYSLSFFSLLESGFVSPLEKIETRTSS